MFTLASTSIDLEQIGKYSFFFLFCCLACRSTVDLSTEASTKSCSVKKLFYKNFAKVTGKHMCCSLFLTLFRMGLFGAAHGWKGPKKAPLPYNLSHISCNNKIWHSYNLTKEDPKNTSITWHTRWVLLTSAFFNRKSANFAISRNTDIDCISIHNFLFF